MQLSVPIPDHHVKGVVVRDPPLVAGDVLIGPVDIGRAAVTVCLVPLAAQHLHTLRHLPLHPAVESRIVGNLRVQTRKTLLHPQLRILYTLADRMFRLIQIVILKYLPYGLVNGAFSLPPFPALIHQSPEVPGLHRLPFPVQRVHGEHPLRMLQRIPGEELPVRLRSGRHARHPPVTLPLLHGLQPEVDLPALFFRELVNGLLLRLGKDLLRAFRRILRDLIQPLLLQLLLQRFQRHQIGLPVPAVHRLHGPEHAVLYSLLYISDAVSTNFRHLFRGQHLSHLITTL